MLEVLWGADILQRDIVNLIGKWFYHHFLSCSVIDRIRWNWFYEVEMKGERKWQTYGQQMFKVIAKWSEEDSLTVGRSSFYMTSTSCYSVIFCEAKPTKLKEKIWRQLSTTEDYFIFYLFYYLVRFRKPTEPYSIFWEEKVVFRSFWYFSLPVGRR